MSLRKKLEQAASFAAKDAVTTERGRVLWLLDKLIRDTETNFKRKLLMESQRQLAKVKLDIAKGVATILRRWIVSGVAPGPAIEQETAEQKAERIAREICEQFPEDDDDDS